jgi:hypothetical protein
MCCTDVYRMCTGRTRAVADQDVCAVQMCCTDVYSTNSNCDQKPSIIKYYIHTCIHLQNEGYPKDIEYFRTT